MAPTPKPSLVAAVILLAVAFLYFSRTMGRAYFDTSVARLKQGDVEAEDAWDERGNRDLLSATLTRMDVGALITEGGLRAEELEKIVRPEAREQEADEPPGVLDGIFLVRLALTAV